MESGSTSSAKYDSELGQLMEERMRTYQLEVDREAAARQAELERAYEAKQAFLAKKKKGAEGKKGGGRGGGGGRGRR